MAINFIQVRVVSLGRGESAVGLGAYICRAEWTNPLTGRTHDFLSEYKKQDKERRKAEAKAKADALSMGPRNPTRGNAPVRKERKKDDVVGEPIVILPEGAPAHFNDALTLWTAAERAEVTLDRKTGLPRFKRNATVAKHVILALPKELSASERKELAIAWARHAYPHVAVTIAIHEAEDPEIGNHHAHLLVSTRTVGPKGFGKKARHLDPRFAASKQSGRPYVESQDLPGQWRDFQNKFFRGRGISLVVDASIPGGGVHWGEARFIPNSVRVEQDANALKAARERIRDPRNLLADAVAHRATFTRRMLQWQLRGYGIVGGEAAHLIDRALADPEVIPLFDPDTGKPLDLYTTKAARAQEQEILGEAKTLLKRKATPKQMEKIKADMPRRMKIMTFSQEQKVAYEHLLLSGRIAIARGIAGAGKSHVIKGAMATLETAGFRVVALAPTNTVVATMASEGFSYANTLHSEKYRLEHPGAGRKGWNANTVVIVDEAGMVDSGMMQWLVTTARETGARLILVGDEAQLTSVERGGMFAILKRKLGAAELKEVRRQHEDWAKAASLHLSEGRIAPALEAYNEHGRIHWSADLHGAMHALVLRWAQHQLHDPMTPRFVYVATNAVANALNNRLQHIRFGGREGYLEFDCDRGRIRLYAEDRVQFHATDKRLGILNGQAGRVVSMTPEEIVVETDAGATLSFDPIAFKGWGLGYCGTTYRGQGKTLTQTYALYDNVRSWSARSTYVALTRHRTEFDLFVPRTLARDLDQLGQQMSRGDGCEASLTYLTAREAAARFPSVPILAVDEAGRERRIDAADPSAAETLAMHWQTALYKRFARDFSTLKRAAKSADRSSSIHSHLSQARSAARLRGIIPETGYPDPRCLKDFIPQNDGLVRSDLPVFKPGDGIDIRPIVVDIEHLQLPPYNRLAERIIQLDHHVIAAILKRLDRAANSLKTTTALFADICVSRHLVRLAQLLKPRDAAGRPQTASKTQFENVLDLDPLSRETLGRFRIEDPRTGERATPAALAGALASHWLARLITERQELGLKHALDTVSMNAAPQHTLQRGQVAGSILAPVLSGRELDDRAAIISGAETARLVPARPEGIANEPNPERPKPTKTNRGKPTVIPPESTDAREIPAAPSRPASKRRDNGSTL